MRLPPHVESGNWSLHRAIVEQAQDAIIYADRDGVIHLWNRGAEMIFGYAAAEVLGRNIDIIVPEKFSRVHAEGFRKALLGSICFPCRK